MPFENAPRDRVDSPPSDSHSAAVRLSEQAFNAMNQHQGEYPHHTYDAILPSFAFESVWPLSQQIKATLMTDELHDPNLNTNHELSQRLDGLHYYWDERGYSSGPNFWGTKHERLYDDNAWIGLDLMDVYKRDGSQDWALDQAKKIFEFEKRGVEEAAKVGHEPGGVMWKEGGGDTQYRAAISTSAAAQLALRLYETTHDAQYLDFAKTQYKWMEDHLDNGQGLYEDGIQGTDGKHDPDIVSYSQGMMMTNAAMLYQATGDKSYLAKAQRTMDSACKWYNESNLENGDVIYNAIFFRNLADTDRILNSPPEARAKHFMMLQGYSDYLHKHMGDDGIVRTPREHAPLDSTEAYLTQAGAVQIFALLAENEPNL